MRVTLALLGCLTLIGVVKAQVLHDGAAFSIPKTWETIDSLELPRADPTLRVTPVSADYYYSLPVRRFYKSYPVYHPAKEPKLEDKDYLAWLKEQRPQEILHDFSALKTEADWAASGSTLGKEVFEAPIADETNPFLGIVQITDVRSSEWYDKLGVPYDDEGLVPFFRYVVTEKGVRLGTFACAMCHSRVEKLPNGKRIVIHGAQGNFPFDRVLVSGPRPAVPALLEAVVLAPANRAAQLLYGAPWIKPDPLEPFLQLRLAERLAAAEAVPPGAMLRHGSHPFSPVQVPDLIGLKDRQYLDRTGLVRHRGPGDLMRYAALNQGIDFLTSYGGFIPAGKEFKELPDAKNPPLELAGGRYSDEQLYALALFLYAIEPPANPYLPKNEEERQVVAIGKEVFRSQGCVRCHTPARGYTNNKLTRAMDYKLPTDHPEKANVLAESVRTDPFLAMKTQRGTGLYKVPSLKGVWYRGPFEHNGSIATLEDWFDPGRLDDDFIPTGWRGPPGAKTRAVRGHEFGLDLVEDERKALIAFLKTL
jgi:hypothetical protein